MNKFENALQIMMIELSAGGGILDEEKVMIIAEPETELFGILGKGGKSFALDGLEDAQLVP
jgi:hypothetical protein